MLCPVELVFVMVLLGRGMVTVEIVHLHGADSVGTAEELLLLVREGKFCLKEACEVSLVNECVIS